MTKQNEKDAKRVPELRFKGFTDDWEQRKLGEIATIVGGGTPSTKNPEYWDGDINWYSPAEIGNQIYAKKSERQITELGLKKSSAKLLPVGTVLFTSRAGIGKTAILNKEACTNQGFQSIIPRSKMLNSYFLFSRTNSLKQYGETMGSGSTFVEVSGKQMSKMPLFIPNINEQSKIAKLFQSLDKTITLHEEKQRQLEQLKKALLQKMFADETGYPVLRFKGFTEKWEQRKLEDLGEILTGSTPSTKHTEYYSKNGIPWVTPTDIKRNITFSTPRKLSALGESVGRIVPKNTLLITCIASIGKNTILGTKGSFNQQINGLIPRFDKYDLYFLFTQSNLWSQKMKHKAATGTMQIVNKKDFTNLNTLVPILSEQRHIGNMFEQLDHLITLHQHKIDNLKRLKRALLQKMFV